MQAIAITPSSEHAHLRSGTAARLAGLPVATLRIWERRYHVADRIRSEGGQRLYSLLDIDRLRLLRRLTGAGHAIGTIAALPLAALERLTEASLLANPWAASDSATNLATAATSKPAFGEAPLSAMTNDALPTARASDAPTPAGTAASTVAVVAVGPGAAQRAAAAGAGSLRLDCASLEAAERISPLPGGCDLLLVRAPSLQPSAGERITALATALAARATVVLYGYAAETTAQRLRAVGIVLCREPIAKAELARQIVAALSDATRASGRGPASSPAAPVARRFGDAAIARYADGRVVLPCECLRHLAEIVQQLTSFERYSDECESADVGDRAMHRELHLLAGAARGDFEQALQRLLALHPEAATETGIEHERS